MAENKNQINAQNSISDQGTPGGIVVKDYDGKLKVFSGGELKELDQYLQHAETSGSQRSAEEIPVNTALTTPKFTDLATVPPDEHFVEPLDKPKTPDTVSELHFHPSDKDDLERELAKINSIFQLSSQKKYSVIKIAEKLTEKHNLAFSAEDSAAFSKLLLSIFRSSRSFLQGREVLIAPKEKSGLAIKPETAESILKIVRYLKEKIESIDGIVLVEDADMQTEPRPAPAKVAAPVQKTAPAATPVMPPPIRPVAQAQPEPRRITPQPVAAAADLGQQRQRAIGNRPTIPRDGGQTQTPRIVQELPPEPKEVQTPPAVQPIQPKSEPALAVQPVMTTSLPQVNRPTASPRKGSIVSDVQTRFIRQTPTKVTGPIEELANMDLNMWRLLDEDPRIRAGKILGKIQNLEQQSLLRKHQGIDAWRGSEVYQLYLALGQHSLEQKKDISLLIADLQQQGKKTLTLPEFEAVSDLNRMLRF